MSSIFLATLGQRPEAITMALDVLKERYSYDSIGILHTEPDHSGISAALYKIKQVLDRDYSEFNRRYHEIQFENGDPLFDIVNQYTAEAYYRGVLTILRDYMVDGYHVHLLVAGGRKAMSIYATLAASLIFKHDDFVWTVLSSAKVLDSRQFHAPPGFASGVQLVQLPILPSRFLPETLAEMDIDQILNSHDDPRENLLHELSEEEMRLVVLLNEHPRVTRKRLASLLGKSVKTVDHQFRSIYRRMDKYYAVHHTHKKQILLDILKKE